jgi:hypothetical protein
MKLALRGALPELQRAEVVLSQLAAAEGIAYTIADFGGVRSQADTTRILGYRTVDYAAYVAALRARNPDATPVAPSVFRPISTFGLSMHNWGAAFDVAVTAHPATMTTAQALTRLQQLAPRAGLRSGITFPKPDPPHMELPISLAEAKRRFQALGGVAGVPLQTIAASAALVLLTAGVLGWLAFSNRGA